MSAGAAIGIGAFALIAAIIGYTTWYLRRAPSSLPGELTTRRRAIAERLRALVSSLPAAPALLSEHLPVHDRTAAVEAKLLAQNPHGALAEAELVLAASGGDPRAHLLLARALLYANQLDGAVQQIERAAESGDESPMRRFLEARTEHLAQLRQLHSDNAEIHDSPLPNMISPMELLIINLEKQRKEGGAGGVWMPGAETEMSDEDISAMVSEHLDRYYRTLETLLDVTDDVPGFADALYHIARMALKVGFVDVGREIFESIEPLMESSPEKIFFARDLAQLRGGGSPVVSPLPKLTGTAKRADKLRVLD